MREKLIRDLHSCQKKFNEAMGRNFHHAVRMLGEMRDDILLQLLGTGDLQKLENIYFNLMLKSVRENNFSEELFYKEKLNGVREQIKHNIQQS